MSDEAPPPPPPPPATSSSTSEESSRGGNVVERSWSTVRSWPTSAKVTSGVLLVLFLVAAVSGGASDDQDIAAEGATTTTDPDDDSTTTTERTTTSTSTSTTTTEPPTTTTTLSPEEERSIAVLAMQTVFEENRASLAETLGGLTDVETVDRLVFENEAVVVDVTSGWASPDNQHDGAWTIMKAMAQLWEPDEGTWWQEQFVPNFQFVNSGRVYTCSGDFMVQMATLAAGRDQWEMTCA